MAAVIPFEANVVASLTGKTISITPGPIGGGVASIMDSTGGFVPSILAFNQLGQVSWVRLSRETQTGAATAVSQTDVPLLANGGVRLFANPNPTGPTAIAVVATVTTSGAVFFTPGQGGII